MREASAVFEHLTECSWGGWFSQENVESPSFARMAGGTACPTKSSTATAAHQYQQATATTTAATTAATTATATATATSYSYSNSYKLHQSIRILGRRWG